MVRTLKRQWKFLLIWFLSVAISLPLGFLAANLLTKSFDDRIGRAGAGIFFLLFVTGLFIGLGQWVALRTRLKVTWIWIPFTAIGFSFGCVISYLLVALIGQGLLNLDDYYGKYYAVYQWVEPSVTLLGAGTLTGILQWLTLERIEQVSIRWVLASGISFALASSIAYLTTGLSWTNSNESQIYFSITFGLVLGLLSCIPAGSLILPPEVELH